MSKYMDTKTGSLEESILGVWTEAAKKQEDLDPVDKKAVKKKFDDRKDKDIDNDGDVDSSDKYLHKRRKTISKAVKDEGNAFGKALKDAKEKGEKTFVVAGKKYNVTEADDFRTHMMYDPKTGKGYEAKSMDDHNRMSKMGYSHKKPKMENYEVGTKARRDHTLNTTPGQSPEEFDQQVGVMQAKNNYMREALAKMWGIEEGKNVFEKNPKKEEKKVKAEKTMTGKKTTEVKVDPDLDK
jgi:hypothetical protein